MINPTSLVFFPTVLTHSQLIMKRRTFLASTSALMLSQLASGCNAQSQAGLRVRLLQDSIPAQLSSGFRRTLKRSVTLKFDPETQLQNLYELLEAWKQQAQASNKEQPILPFVGRRTPAAANLVTMGDYWLEAAIKQELIQPLEIEQLQGWQQLPSQWQEIVRRDTSGQLLPSGPVWGAPYRWGTTVIVYHREKFKALGWTPTDWSDLWRPELRGRISLLDQPREVIGLTLKKLGFSYNTTDLNQVANLKDELRALHQQAKLYSSDNYLKPLVLEDTWLALGWSTDVVPLLARSPEIGAVVPLSGTALWTDVWVQPASSQTQEQQSLMQQWIEFCWQPKPAREISLFTNAVSPILINVKSPDLPPDLRQNRLLLPSSPVLEKSEFIKPIPASAVEQYLALWKEIRLATA